MATPPSASPTSSRARGLSLSSGSIVAGRLVLGGGCLISLSSRLLSRSGRLLGNWFLGRGWRRLVIARRCLVINFRRLFARRQQHAHVAAFLQRLGLDHGETVEVLIKAL